MVDSIVATHDGQVYEDEASFWLNKPMEGSEGEVEDRRNKPMNPAEILPRMIVDRVKTWLGRNQYPPGEYSDSQLAKDLGINDISSSIKPQSSSKQLYFVRHGDTDLNEESGERSHDQPIRGWSQVSLNDDGRKEAQRAAESVKDLGITHIVSSDLPRAKETADIIGKEIGVTPETHPGLRTWDLGDFTEQTGKDTHDAVNSYCNEKQDERPPGSSESFNEFKDRILGTVSDIIQQHPDDHKVLVVSHNSPERVLHAWTEAGQPQKQQGFIDKILSFFKPKSEDKSYPTDKESDLARDVNLSYGDPAARYVNPDLASYRTQPIEAFEQLGSKYAQRHSVTLEKADEFNKAWLAARRSPLSQLGFDPGSVTQSPDPEKDAKELNVAGITTIKSNEIWSNPYYQTNIIHESMHRGLIKLINEGILPPTTNQEAVVRKAMLKHFGDVEVRQTEMKATDEALDAIEKMAADYIAKKRPGGPR